MRLVLTSMDDIEGVEALRQAQRTFNAAGFVIVPKEPTREMVESGVLAATLERDHLAEEGAPEIYRAKPSAMPPAMLNVCIDNFGN